VETVAERMADYLVGHYAPAPRSHKAVQAVIAARCLQDSAHGFMMTTLMSTRTDYGRHMPVMRASLFQFVLSTLLSGAL
jgi:hypothetical protein